MNPHAAEPGTYRVFHEFGAHIILLGIAVAFKESGLSTKRPGRRPRCANLFRVEQLLRLADAERRDDGFFRSSTRRNGPEARRAPRYGRWAIAVAKCFAMMGVGLPEFGRVRQ